MGCFNVHAIGSVVSTLVLHRRRIRFASLDMARAHGEFRYPISIGLFNKFESTFP